MSEEKKSFDSKTILFFFGIAFLFLLVFFLGVMVGKGLNKGSSDFVVSEESVKKPVAEEPESRVVTKEVIAKEEEDPIKVPNYDKYGKVFPPIGDEITDEDIMEKMKVKVEVTDKEKQAEKDRKETAVATIKKFPKVDVNGKYTVQIGSFKDKANVERGLKKYKAKGYPAFIKKSSKDKATLYRLRIGTFNSYKKAREYEKLLKTKEKSISTLVMVNN